MQNKNRTLALTQFSMLLALEAVICFTPLGQIPIGPMVATIAHIPIIIAAVVLGMGAGAALGAIAGLFSVCIWTFNPPNPAIAFVYTPLYSFGDIKGNFCSILISFVPRILIGVIASLVYTVLSKKLKEKSKGEFVAYSVASILGSFANTFGVLGGIYVFFGRQYADVFGQSYSALLGLIGMVVATNGVLEAVLAAVVTATTCGAIKRVLAKSTER